MRKENTGKCPYCVQVYRIIILKDTFYTNLAKINSYSDIEIDCFKKPTIHECYSSMKICSVVQSQPQLCVYAYLLLFHRLHHLINETRQTRKGGNMP